MQENLIGTDKFEINYMGKLKIVLSYGFKNCENVRKILLMKEIPLSSSFFSLSQIEWQKAKIKG